MTINYYKHILHNSSPPIFNFKAVLASNIPLLVDIKYKDSPRSLNSNLVNPIKET